MFFDSSQEEDVSFEPLPKGVYALTVTNVEYGPNSSGTGAILKVEYLVDGYGERKIFDNFNIQHQNEKAARIGRGQLKRLCEMAGRPQLNQPHDLIGAKVAGEIIHREYEGNTYMNIKKYIKYDEAANVGGKPKQSYPAPNGREAQTQYNAGAKQEGIPF